MDLKDVPTANLVEELKHREGVEYKEIPPYENVSFETNSVGPAIVFLVTD